MLPIRELPLFRADGHAAPGAIYRPGHVAILLRVLAVSGYGMWTWLGMALALGLHRIGRCDALMPLLLGAVLVGAGLLLACLQLPATGSRQGWHPDGDRNPARAAWISLATYLPVLLVIAVGGGAGSDSSLTRLAGVVLMLASVASLVYTAYSYRCQLSPSLQRASSSLPIIRLVAAWYGGGLWLWLCAMAQGGLAPSQRVYPWVLLLLALALLLGLLEGLRWQSVHAPEVSDSELLALGQPPARFAAAVLVYVVPCATLLLSERFGHGLLAAALVVPSCMLGTMLEQHAYETTLIGATPLHG